LRDTTAANQRISVRLHVNYRIAHFAFGDGPGQYNESPERKMSIDPAA
jgi:hypothetical protein